MSTARFPTPLGAMEAALGPAGEVVRLEFVGPPGEPGGSGAAEGAASPEGPVPDGPVAAVERQVAGYFAGERRAFDLALDPQGTDFELAVWEALLEIDWGETTSYGSVAGRIGRPDSVRAVGRAVGSNPIAIVVPCHRVLGAGGTLTGYSAGIERKRALLELEGSLPLELEIYYGEQEIGCMAA